MRFFYYPYPTPLWPMINAGPVFSLPLNILFWLIAFTFTPELAFAYSNTNSIDPWPEYPDVAQT